MRKNNQPLVSIGCITYNQEEYIAQALEGFVTQETNFPFEVLIHDDASTDKTVDIIREYEKKYPDIIKPIYQTENQFSQGINITFTYQLPRIKGKYFALCEGDDFWTDTTKLQRQVDFLESNHNYSLVFHPVEVFFQYGERPSSVFPDITSGFSVKRLLEGNFIQTNSVMYRVPGDYSDIVKNVMPGDWYLHLYHAQYGKIGFLNRVMSSYRRHPGGIWWGAYNGQDEIWKKHGVAHLALYFEHLRMYGKDIAYRDIIINHIVGMIGIFLRIDYTYGTKLLMDSVEKFSNQSDMLIGVVSGTLSGTYRNHEKLKKEVEMLRNDLGSVRSEISKIKSSKRYRYAEKIARLIDKIKLK